jgi:hypothetical protein
VDRVRSLGAPALDRFLKAIRRRPDDFDLFVYMMGHLDLLSEGSTSVDYDTETMRPRMNARQ